MAKKKTDKATKAATEYANTRNAQYARRRAMKDGDLAKFDFLAGVQWERERAKQRTIQKKVIENSCSCMDGTCSFCTDKIREAKAA